MVWKGRVRWAALRPNLENLAPLAVLALWNDRPYQLATTLVAALIWNKVGRLTDIGRMGASATVGIIKLNNIVISSLVMECRSAKCCSHRGALQLWLDLIECKWVWLQENQKILLPKAVE